MPFSERLSTQRREVFESVFSETRGMPQVVRAATALSAFLDQKEIFLSADDLLAGHEQYYDYRVPSEEEPASTPDERALPLQEEIIARTEHAAI
ncbi:MAG TPA: hypothetical protein VFH83_03900 [Spirochaetia bacterium]|nr:hypothetical protein [Spirochaetia bacterium]